MLISGSMSNPGLAPGVIAAHIRDAEDRKSRALVEYQAATAELDWWKRGQQLFGGGGTSEPDDSGADFDFLVASLNPDEQPSTLRQAIATVMWLEDKPSWNAREITLALDRRGWLPKHEPIKRVTDMAGVMATAGQLRKEGRGSYSLAPELAASFDLASSRDKSFSLRASENQE